MPPSTTRRSGNDTVAPTLRVLPEVVAAVGDQVEVLMDGGIRRGSDVLKALAMGAKACGIGRPYIWGLGSFGQKGVERVLEILRTELEVDMQQCGVSDLNKITKALYRRVSA